jgi:hypothetical protein
LDQFPDLLPNHGPLEGGFALADSPLEEFPVDGHFLGRFLLFTFRRAGITQHLERDQFLNIDRGERGLIKLNAELLDLKGWNSNHDKSPPSECVPDQFMPGFRFPLPGFLPLHEGRKGSATMGKEGPGLINHTKYFASEQAIFVHPHKNRVSLSLMPGL